MGGMGTAGAVQGVPTVCWTMFFRRRAIGRSVNLNVISCNMKLKTIQDINNLPTVLDIQEVNKRLIEIVEVIRNTPRIKILDAAEAINDLICSQAHNEEGLSVKTSLILLDWIKEVYDPNDNELLNCLSANLANLNCLEAKIFIESLIRDSTSEYEKNELIESLKEMRINTET
ncbi:hypothetical protein ACFL4N_05155 [Thermodesulfobacteriota bacterium]